MKLIQFVASWFETDGAGNCVERFPAGSYHAITEATERQVALGNAVVVDAPNDAEKAEDAAEKADAKAAAAQAAADAAREAADAATAAAEIADAARVAAETAKVEQ